MKFLVRTLVRNLWIGAMMRTVLPALAQAVVMNASLHERTVENLKEQLQDLLVPCLLEKGIAFSSVMLRMVPGIPIKPMLANIANFVPKTESFCHDPFRTRLVKWPLLDALVVAVDRKNGCKILSFQELSSRERVSKDSLITVDSIKVDICVLVFDIMFANGEQ
ncbi:hypothetical protein RHMOL_Rhmol05G0103700 [Rhododendron molle]|uniref:Uncharacterized protein n=1 Tax=Rhododendron molle TaxID=49168 RepID=A0ACC0NNE5_RHOML|nr:hypothetical protein RHMOL_Rhmol05G0103700 [Rhododendron molle]